jgi:hypothetical protein
VRTAVPAAKAIADPPLAVLHVIASVDVCILDSESTAKYREIPGTYAFPITLWFWVIVGLTVQRTHVNPPSSEYHAAQSAALLPVWIKLNLLEGPRA